MAGITQTAAAVGDAASPARRDGLRNSCLLAVVSVALAFGYRDALAAMVRLWNNSPMYSYGFTVPLVSAYLLWTRRSAFGSLTPQPSWRLGGLVLAAALLLTVAGRAGGILVLEQLAFLVSVAGSALLLFGAPYVRVGWAALAYLLLMVPMWDGLTELLHQPFQNRSAAIGIWILHLLEIPAFREGTFITLPNLQIEVARACSGVNYLVAVVALGLPLGYVFLLDNWRRAVLLISALVVAALSNGLRVALICILAYYEVGSPLHGPFHVLHGLFVAGVGYVVLFAGLRLLGPKAGREAGAPPEWQAERLRARGASPRVSLTAVAVLLCIFGLTGSTALARASLPVPANGALESFPDQLGVWVADPHLDTRQDASSQLFPGADKELSRRYRRPDGSVVDLYLGYFASQRQQKEMVTDRTAVLHDRATRRFIAGAEGPGFSANHVPADESGVQLLFWYELDRVPQTSRYAVKARTFWSGVWRAHTNGAVVVLSSRASDAGASATVLDDLAGLVREALAARWPGSEAVR
jgi:EpsI family protein